jgi:hypothetical protein
VRDRQDGDQRGAEHENHGNSYRAGGNPRIRSHVHSLALAAV